MSASYLILDPALHDIANVAMKKIMARYNLSQPLVEKPINDKIPWRPTFLWKRSTEYLACEVANRPFPVTIKQQFADIIASGQPIRIIVAYPKNNSLTSSDYQKDIITAKMFGVGYIGIDQDRNIDVEYNGVSLALYISNIDLKDYAKILRPSIADAYEHYMLKGDPDVGLQKIGQLTEAIIYNLPFKQRRQEISHTQDLDHLLLSDKVF